MVAFLIGLIPALELAASDAAEAAAAVAAIRSLLGGASIGAALAHMSAAELLPFAEKAVAAGPQVLTLLAQVHAAFETFEQIQRIFGAQQHAENIAAWFGRPADEIPAYGADGGVVEIPNPDLKRT